MRLFLRLLNPDYWLNRLLEKVFKVRKFDWYELRGNEIIKHSPAETKKINIKEIISWAITNEMVFDLVKIQMKNGEIIVWEDYYNDLVSILSTLLGQMRLGR
jgi:hypothetical protein